MFPAPLPLTLSVATVVRPVLVGVKLSTELLFGVRSEKKGITVLGVDGGDPSLWVVDIVNEAQGSVCIGEELLQFQVLPGLSQVEEKRGPSGC